MDNRLLITGVAGFIGAALCRKLVLRETPILGIDNLNDYYDVNLKKARLGLFDSSRNFSFCRIDLADRALVQKTFEEFKPNIVVHLAAQAGVRYSLSHPHAYIDSNIVGFLNILEGCRHFGTQHLVFASSSSVYGANTSLPYSVKQPADHPLSLYAASKKSNELMAHAYSHLYRLPTTGLRFFTVYGPWGRPDMAIFRFTESILQGRPIDVYNHGHHRRDFTYIDDVVDGILRVLDSKPQEDENWNSAAPDPSRSRAPYRIFNIGNSAPVWLDELIETLELTLGKKAIRNNLPMQAGDVLETFADVNSLVEELHYRPSTPLKEGIRRFVEWYTDYYNISLR